MVNIIVLQSLKDTVSEVGIQTISTFHEKSGQGGGWGYQGKKKAGVRTGKRT